MYTLIVENAKGEQLHLTDNDNYDVVEVTGTNPPVAAINTTNVTGMDGSRFNSSRIGQRNIVITLNIKPPIEANRLELYKYFQVKRYIKVYYKNDHRDVYIEGYVESFENNPWTQLQKPQISIICPDPFWKSINDTIINFSSTIALFEFPFSIPSEGIPFSEIQRMTTAQIDVGDVETGAIIEFHATTDQILAPKLYNLTTNEFFGINIDMEAGDTIIVNTERGKKSVILIQDGVSTNILSDRKKGSTWLTFQPGINELSYDAYVGTENLRVKVTVTPKFEGV